MSIYYTQILNKDSKKILTAAFSHEGQSFKTDNPLLLDLKKSVFEVPQIQKISSLHTEDKSKIFFFKITSKLFLAAIADNRTTGKIISKYFEDIEASYEKLYANSINTPHYDFDDQLKRLTDTFNKKFKLLLGAEELENTHISLVENLDKVIHRGENINNLKNLAEKVNFETREMSRRVNKMKFDAKYNEYKIYVIAILAIIVLFVIFLKFK